MTTQWMRARLLDGTKFKLVLFPESDSHRATWDNIAAFIFDQYGDNVGNIVSKYMHLLKENPSYSKLDIHNRYIPISWLPVDQKYSHPDFMSAERLLQQGDAATLLQVRAFFDHSLGCNSKYLGTGLSPNGQPECFVLNRPLSQIPGCVILDLNVTLEELELEEQLVLT
jgi:hypothetical protein